MSKDPEAFRTISEVSESLGIPQHILRFWETRFPELKPLKRGGNRRYYRPADVALAAALQKLLHSDGYTVKGVRKLISDHGIAGIIALTENEAIPATAAREASAETIADSLPTGAPAAEIPVDLLARLSAVRNRLAAAIAAG